jgi:hypothetical protein
LRNLHPGSHARSTKSSIDDRAEYRAQKHSAERVESAFLEVKAVTVKCSGYSAVIKKRATSTLSDRKGIGAARRGGRVEEGHTNPLGKRTSIDLFALQ